MLEEELKENDVAYIDFNGYKYNIKDAEILNRLKEQSNYDEIKSALSIKEFNMIVTPKEIDELIENMKDVVVRGINFAL